MKKVMLVVLVIICVLQVCAYAVEFSADMHMDVSFGSMDIGAGENEPGKIYYKNPKMTRQDMMEMIILYVHPLSHQLFPKTHKYVTTNVEEEKRKASANNPLANVSDWEQFIRDNHFSKTGSETLEGFACDIHEGEIALHTEQRGEPVELKQQWKTWYAAKLGYVIKTEVISKPSQIMPNEAKTTISFKNITLGTQPESLFEIPSEYTEAASIQEAMGFEGIPGLQGTDSKALSPQEREEMMKKMEEMMEKLKEQKK